MGDVYLRLTSSDYYYLGVSEAKIDSSCSPGEKKGGIIRATLPRLVFVFSFFLLCCYYCSRSNLSVMVILHEVRAGHGVRERTLYEDWRGAK